MIIQLSTVPKADKSIIIAVMRKAAYKRLFGFPRIWLVLIIFRSFGLYKYSALSVCVFSLFTHPCMCISVFFIHMDILHVFAQESIVLFGQVVFMPLHKFQCNSYELLRLDI